MIEEPFTILGHLGARDRWGDLYVLVVKEWALRFTCPYF